MKKLAILLAVLLIAGMFVTFVSCGTHMAETGNENNDNTEQESPAQPEDDDKDSENNSTLYTISYNLLAATSADTVQNGLTLTDSVRLKEQMAFILAEKADISTSLVGKIESTNIHQGISIYTLWKISNALGVPIELFFVPPKSEK